MRAEETDAMGPVIVRSSGTFRNEIEVDGKHRLIADEPADAGGTGAGPTPYDFLSAALGTCTSMTLQFLAKRDGIPLTGIEVQVSNDRMYAKDCADCMTTSGYIHRFEVQIKLNGDLTDAQREKLLDAARRCPVYKTLTAEIRIHEVLA
jgi:putative redox protein